MAALKTPASANGKSGHGGLSMQNGIMARNAPMASCARRAFAYRARARKQSTYIGWRDGV